MTQFFPAEPGKSYEVRVAVRAVRAATCAGAYVQLRFLPSQELAQTDLDAESTNEFNEVSVAATAPPGTKAAQVCLYTHREPMPTVRIGHVRLVSGVEVETRLPEPVPPVYTRLKELHLTTDLARDGQPAIRIVAPASGLYKRAAERLQQTIQELAGVRVPIVADNAPAAAVPIRGNLIVLGNRSTSQTISELYDRYFCLTDLRYPGGGGYELRSLHNPFGGGHNVLLCGGSDLKGWKPRPTR